MAKFFSRSETPAVQAPAWCPPSAGPELIGQAAALEARRLAVAAKLDGIEADRQALLGCPIDDIVSGAVGVKSRALAAKKIEALQESLHVHNEIAAMGPALNPIADAAARAQQNEDAAAFDLARAEVWRRLISIGFADAPLGADRVRGMAPYEALLAHPMVLEGRAKSDAAAGLTIKNDVCQWAANVAKAQAAEVEAIRERFLKVVVV
jgi:hypothetical protein